MNGDGVEQDYVKAKHYYDQAAEQGVMMHNAALGIFTMTETVSSKSTKRQESIMKKAANQGDADAQSNLGISTITERVSKKIMTRPNTIMNLQQRKAMPRHNTTLVTFTSLGMAWSVIIKRPRSIIS